MTDRDLPSDVYEDSGYRLPLPNRDDLTEGAKKIFDQVSDPEGGSLVGLRGPGGLRLHSPRLSECTNHLNQYFRKESAISGRVRELAILTTARAMDNQFEWAAHEPAARRQGIEDAVIDVVKHRRGTEGVAEADAVIIDLGRQVFGPRRVSPETFSSALAIYGKIDLIDIVSLMGHYSATAALLTAFDIQLHPGAGAAVADGLTSARRSGL